MEKFESFIDFHEHWRYSHADKDHEQIDKTPRKCEWYVHVFTPSNSEWI